jgi:hypothetical protein
MKKIKLTRGKYAVVDDEDFAALNQWNWCCDSSGYAARDVGGRKNKKRVLMHRLLNNTPDGFVTDHINRNKLDNRKANLRSLTQRQNTYNSSLSKNNKSGFNGVCWWKHPRGQGYWVATIKVNYKKIHLGYFKKLADAVNARKLADQKYAAI